MAGYEHIPGVTQVAMTESILHMFLKSMPNHTLNLFHNLLPLLERDDPGKGIKLNSINFEQYLSALGKLVHNMVTEILGCYSICACAWRDQSQGE
jgi:hypothetical protein